MSEATHYRHTQFAWLNVVILVGLVGPITWYAYQVGPFSALLPALIFVGGLVWFTTFTVIVTRDCVECRFGPGPVRKRVALADVESVEVVRNSLWETGGWGIRLIRGGTLWNISGFSAVELRLRTGNVFRIGSDEPTRLAQQIEAARQERSGRVQ